MPPKSVLVFVLFLWFGWLWAFCCWFFGFCFCFAPLLPLRKQKADGARSAVCWVWPGLISTCQSLGALGWKDLHMGRVLCLHDVSLSRVGVTGLRKQGQRLCAGG